MADEHAPPTDGDPSASEPAAPGDTDTADDAEAASPGRWPRVLVVAASALALLLVGAAAGMLITNTVVGPASQPAEDSVDVGFSQDMAVHHLQAVTMANVARENSHDPAVRNLAFDIASTQLGQVGRMKGWLTLWGQPEQSVSGTYMGWMPGSGSGHGNGHGGHGMSSGARPSGDAPMPGMASSAELAKLRSLSGKQLDVYFLQLMLRHHQGGVPMAEYAYEHAGVEAVRALARSMLLSQGNEIDLMTSMLAERGATPLPAP